MLLELRPITQENWRDCVHLSVSEEQLPFIVSNAYSLAQAAYMPQYYPLAIYRAARMVGFVLYGYDPLFGVWGVTRLMVDKSVQRQGIGKAALIALMEKMRIEHGNIQFFTSAKRDNAIGILFCESAGFAANGGEIEGETVLVVQL